MSNRDNFNSETLFSEAKKYIPGGVNSPVRAFNNVDCSPKFIERGQGPWIYDVEGNKYLDYVLSWGPLILGHAHSGVISRLQRVAAEGTSFGAPVETEIELARLIVDSVPGIDMIRFVNSGTEAVMTAVRLARAFTERDKIVKMTGCYHGHSDGLLVEAGSGPAELAIPGTPGVPESFARETISVPYNDRQAVARVFDSFSGEIAALVLEPIPANMGVILPEAGYLEFLRHITEQNDSLLIFDEVITGFRVASGGAQELYGVKPDLTCLGKIIGGGLPVGACGGRRDIMEYIAPQGPVYQAGTLSGNPLAVAAGVETLQQLQEKTVYENLQKNTEYLVTNMRQIASDSGISVKFNQLPGLFSVFFSEEQVSCYREAAAADRKMFKRYFQAMLVQGIYLAPSPFEASFLSVEHNKEELDFTLEVFEKVLKKIEG